VFERKRTGSVLCASCGVLVGVNDDTCYHCGRRNPSLWGYAPALKALGNDFGFVPFVFGLCAVMYVLTLIASQGGITGGGLNFLGPDGRALLIFGASGGGPVFGLHRWWTVLSAGWLHGGLLHIVLNMYSLRILAPLVVELYGAARMVIIYTVGSVVGFTLSSVAAIMLPAIPLIGGGAGYGHFTIGASASLAGLLGAMVYYGRRSGSSMIRAQANQWVVSMLVYGFIIQGIDNYAHVGGLAGGYLAARMLDPLKAERVDHAIMAIVCLLASVAAILYSAVPILIELNR
jgi:rhomboid protease GluP